MTLKPSCQQLQRTISNNFAHLVQREHKMISTIPNGEYCIAAIFEAVDAPRVIVEICIKAQTWSHHLTSKVPSCLPALVFMSRFRPHSAIPDKLSETPGDIPIRRLQNQSQSLPKTLKVIPV
jgi:hypothetical protein